MFIALQDNDFIAKVIYAVRPLFATHSSVHNSICALTLEPTGI